MFKKFIFVLTICFLFFPVLSIAQPELLPGWPIDNGVAGGSPWDFNQSPLTIVEDTDGSLLILTCNGDEIIGYDINGQITDDGFNIEGIIEGLDIIGCGPIVGEFNNQPGPDILVSVHNQESGNGRGIIAASDGQIIEDLVIEFDQDVFNQSAIVVVNVDGDPLDEIMFTADGQLYVINADGSNVEGFPYPIINSDAHGFSSPALYQWPNRESVFFWVSADNQLHAKIYDADGELEGFPVSAGDGELGSPIVIPTGQSWRVSIISDQELYLFEDTGETVTGFPLSFQDMNIMQTSFIAADVDGNALAELVFKTEDGNIHAIDQVGSEVDGFPYDMGVPGFWDPLVALKQSTTSISNLFFGNFASANNSNIYGIGDQVEGFPISLTTIEPEPYIFSACTMPADGSFYLVIQSLQGYTSVYSVPFEAINPLLEWPMPNNTPGGNRLYKPVMIEVDTPYLTFIPDELDFGDLLVGEIGEATIVVENTGEALGTIYSAWVSENISDEVTVETNLPINVPAGQSETIELSWIPQTAGFMFGEITFNHNDSNHNNNEVVSVSGQYLIPVLEFNPTLIDFGDLQDGESGQEEITISNTGVSTGTVTSFSVPDEIVDEIQVAGLPVDIEAGQDTTLIISWTPQESTELRDILTFTHNAPVSNYAQNINLTGNYFSSINEEECLIPSEFQVSNNFPNPFNPSTNLKISLPNSSDLLINIFNVQGQLLKSDSYAKLTAKEHIVNIQLADFSSGIYYYQVRTSFGNKSGKMLLIK